MKNILTETYIDRLDRFGERKYHGESLYRVIGFVKEEDRTQMYTIGLGKQEDEEGSNFFIPKVRAARYTTEEAIVFLTKDKAKEFFRKFKMEYSDNEEEFDLSEFSIAEYNPFHEVIKLIPISTPIGDAFVTEQKVLKKAYEAVDEEEPRKPIRHIH